MYIFNKITVIPQLPDAIGRLSEIANNLWWAWNTEFLGLLKMIDLDLWLETRNPVKFLKLVSQDKIEEASQNAEFLHNYTEVVRNFDNYMNSKETWFDKNLKENKKDTIAYFSAEYGLDETMPIYSGGLGILSGDHVKSASDLGLPFVAIGLLYRNGFFRQRITTNGEQICDYQPIDLYNLPITPAKDSNGEEIVTDIDLADRKIYLKIWQVNVGRIKLYLMDSDIPQNEDYELREITKTLYGGDKEMRIRQEIILGMAGVKVLKLLGFNPTVYHMNEGHSAFLTLELIKNIMQERNVSFDVAKEITTSMTAFTTHTPVPAGNDIFDIELVDKYFKGYCEEVGISREVFLHLGMKSKDVLEPGFNMGVLALRISGKKNGVSKLHGEVSRELFSEVWPNIADDESPITYVTNGVHTCTWLAPRMKELYNEYLPPYWQDNIQSDEIWKSIDNIPNEELWDVHISRKEKLINLIKNNLHQRYEGNRVNSSKINEFLSFLDPNALTIGFARRFATYKRASLIFTDIARLTKILGDKDKPVQIVFAGKAHPHDKEGQELLKRIHDLSLLPQFKGKIFILENYNIGIARYLVSGVDVWLNNPRRPMEASGTSGEKASINGVVNFSVLDGWWAEGYNGTNGWAIGTNEEFDSYEEQDKADSNSLYDTLENQIIPIYFRRNSQGFSDEWVKLMKNSIKSTGGKYSTSRMLIDYLDRMYLPLCNLNKKYFKDTEKVYEFNNWKKISEENWKNISIKQEKNVDNAKFLAGSEITVNCEVKLPGLDVNHVMVQAYFGQIQENGIVKNIFTQEMQKTGEDKNNQTYTFETTLKLKTGGNFAYSFRVMPKHEMLLDPENMNLIKWLED